MYSFLTETFFFQKLYDECSEMKRQLDPLGAQCLVNKNRRGDALALTTVDCALTMEAAETCRLTGAGVGAIEKKQVAEKWGGFAETDFTLQHIHLGRCFFFFKSLILRSSKTFLSI